MSTFQLRSGPSRPHVQTAVCRQINALSLESEWIVTIEPLDKKRTGAQNRLVNKWHGEAAAQLQDEMPEEKRGFCKLNFGVPILRAEDEKFCAEYDAIIRPLPYEAKLKLMMVPFDFAVTRNMKKKQMSKYMDAVWNHYARLGVQLTEPNSYEEWRK